MLLGTLGARLLGYSLTGKGMMRAGEGIVRVGEGTKKNLNSLLPFHPLTNIEISEYYKLLKEYLNMNNIELVDINKYRLNIE